MDNKKFIEELKKVADIKDATPKVIKTEHDTDSELEEVLFKGEIIKINRDVNPTLGVKLSKVKELTQACELGCGDIVTGQVVEHRLVMTPYKHWRKRCKTCNMWLHPNGQEFVDNPTSLALEESKWINSQRKLKPQR